MFKHLRRRVETGAIVTAIVVPLALCVFAFLGLAGYFALRESLPPHLAALVTAAGGIVLIALVLIIARIAGASRSRSSRRGSNDVKLADDLEEFLRDHVDPVMSDWIRSHPDKAAITTLVLGIAAGYSDQFRHILMDLYTRYAESEAVRRSRRD